MLKKIALGFSALIVLFLIYVALQPADYMVTRSVTINASAEKIFPYLNSSKRAEAWGPWLEMDPNAKMNHEGPEEGIGSKSSWDSSGQLGTGSATIVDVIPMQKVGIKLEYAKPMSMEQYSEYIVTPAGEQTTVEWRVTGKNTFMGRLMCTFMDMDKMVGGMFEKGLNKLKQITEAQ